MCECLKWDELHNIFCASFYFCWRAWMAGMTSHSTSREMLMNVSARSSPNTEVKVEVASSIHFRLGSMMYDGSWKRVNPLLIHKKTNRQEWWSRIWNCWNCVLHPPQCHNLIWRSPSDAEEKPPENTAALRWILHKRKKLTSRLSWTIDRETSPMVRTVPHPVLCCFFVTDMIDDRSNTVLIVLISLRNETNARQRYFELFFP